MKLRLYISKLPKADARLFVAPGERCTLNEDLLAKTQAAVHKSLSNKKLHVDWRLEKPDILEARLNAALLADKGRLQHPVRSDCQESCQDFVCFAIGKSKNWFNQPKKNNASRTSPMEEKTDRVFNVNAEYAMEADRPALKARLVKDWLEQQRQEHLVMPNAECTILPYKTKREAHGCFVLDTEQKVCADGGKAGRDLVSHYGGSSAQDPAQEDGGDVGGGGDDVILSARDARYGNVGMGPKGMAPEHDAIASLSWFEAVWNKQTNEEGTPFAKMCKIRAWMPFAKCDTCTGYREESANTCCPKEKARLKLAQYIHLERVKRERLSYVMRQRLAKLYPLQYMSMIIDGADTSSFMIPHLSERSHVSDMTTKVKMHVLGCIVHGADTYAYTCPPHIAQGHNITIQVLFYVLLDILSKMGSLPPVLFLQLDNTTKQNKGRFLMAFLAYLVLMGVLKSAYINFLPVGHTHEDIDQFFSRLSVYLRSHNAPDVPALLDALRSCFHKFGKRPIVAPWTKVANISSYLGEYTTRNLSMDITLYYQLRIIMGEGGHVIMQARTWPGADKDDKNDFWRGLLPDTSFVRVFETKPDLLGHRMLIPVQAQPAHIGGSGDKAQRKDYGHILKKTSDSIEALMKAKPKVFGESEVANMRALVKSLSSNLNAREGVAFHWKQADMQLLFGQGVHVDHGHELGHGELEGSKCKDASLYDDSHLVADELRRQPDPQKDPQGFQEAIEAGEINLLSTENTQACVLRASKFYLQRPPTYNPPFLLVKVIRVIYDDPPTNKIQWGAWCQHWEISTKGDDMDYYADPYHANSKHQDGQAYKVNKSGQPAWSYESHALSTFQDEVTMNKTFKKKEYKHAAAHNHTNHATCSIPRATH